MGKLRSKRRLERKGGRLPSREEGRLKVWGEEAGRGEMQGSGWCEARIRLCSQSRID